MFSVIARATIAAKCSGAPSHLLRSMLTPKPTLSGPPAGRLDSTWSDRRKRSHINQTAKLVPRGSGRTYGPKHGFGAPTPVRVELLPKLPKGSPMAQAGKVFRNGGVEGHRLQASSTYRSCQNRSRGPRPGKCFPETDLEGQCAEYLTLQEGPDAAKCRQTPASNCSSPSYHCNKRSQARRVPKAIKGTRSANVSTDSELEMLIS